MELNKQCHYCQKELKGKQELYCSHSCRKKWNYHHTDYRDKQLQRMNSVYQPKRSVWKRLSELTEEEKIHLQKIWDIKNNNG